MHEDHFLRPAEPHNGRIRARPCGTCAFRRDSPVRPGDFDQAAFDALCQDVDDFVCHVADHDGTYPSCAGWHAAHAPRR